MIKDKRLIKYEQQKQSSESTNGYEIRQNSKQRCTEGIKYLFSIENTKTFSRMNGVKHKQRR
jgi:hypothetical protein